MLFNVGAMTLWSIHRCLNLSILIICYFVWCLGIVFSIPSQKLTRPNFNQTGLKKKSSVWVEHFFLHFLTYFCHYVSIKLKSLKNDNFKPLLINLHMCTQADQKSCWSWSTIFNRGYILVHKVLAIWGYNSASLTLCMLVTTFSSADYICKQFGPRSGLTKVVPHLDPNCLTLMVFLKDFFWKCLLQKKSANDKNIPNYLACKELNGFGSQPLKFI